MAWRENAALTHLKSDTIEVKTLVVGGDPFNGISPTANVATVAGTGNTLAQTAGVVQQSVITLTDHAVTITFEVGDDSGHGNSKLLDFPEGRILVLGVTADFSIDVSGSANISDTGSGDLALGTTGTADTTLSGTDVDLLPSTAMTDPFVAGIGSASGALAASAQFDGTTTAKDAYFNIAFDAGDVTTADGEAEITGTVTLTWINLGDY